MTVAPFFTLSKGGEPEIFLETIYMKSGGRLSPDGKWVAFNAGDSGRDEVYIAPFPKADRKTRIPPMAAFNRSGTPAVPKCFFWICKAA